VSPSDTFQNSAHAAWTAARSAASCGEISDDPDGGADDSTTPGDGLAGGALELGRNVLGSTTDGLAVTDTTAVDVGPSAELVVHPAASMSTPTEKAPVRRRVPTFIL
jgi:hypothetical protein